MNTADRHVRGVPLAVAALLGAGATAAWCHGAAPGAVPLRADDVPAAPRIGRVRDDIRPTPPPASLYQDVAEAYVDAVQWKARVQEAAAIAFAMDVSVLAQWGFPDGGAPTLQVFAAPSLDWTLFRSAHRGTGSVQIAYNAIGYPVVQTGAALQSNLGLITPINDYSTRFLNFSRLTYTQATPDHRWLFTLGQYPFYGFDGNAYLGNQQLNFNNYLFAQNATQTYLMTGLGAFVQFNATGTIQLATGLQATNNYPGETITLDDAGADCCAWFGYLQWSPSVPGLGSAQYSFSYFDTPAIPAQPATRNWSVNAVQNLDDRWAVFARANGADGFVTQIKNAYALGVALNNPLKRAATDQFAVAVGLSEAADPPVTPPGARNEKTIEVYWTWTLFGGLLITPAVQVIFDPALDPRRANATVLSLRTTFRF